RRWALHLRPVHALVVPALRLAPVQWRVRQVRLHRRIFTAAEVGLSFGAASLVFHGILGIPLGGTVAPGGQAPAWIVAVAVAGVVRWSVDTGLRLPALQTPNRAKAAERLLGW